MNIFFSVEYMYKIKREGNKSPPHKDCNIQNYCPCRDKVILFEVCWKSKIANKKFCGTVRFKIILVVGLG